MNNRKIRVLLLTDSLGCPRAEIEVDNVWTERIISEFGDKITFYTLCSYGLSAKNVPKDYVGYLKPDLIICQIGIVDACRRALTTIEESIISRIPFFSKVVRGVCSRNHYFFTKHRNIHYASEREFSSSLDELIKGAGMRIMFIEIAPPGKFLIGKTYNVEKDIKNYNNIIYKKEDKEKVIIIRPYSERESLDCSEYLIGADGHHLNKQGNNMVFEAVRKQLCEFLVLYNGVKNKV